MHSSSLKHLWRTRLARPSKSSGMTKEENTHHTNSLLSLHPLGSSGRRLLQPHHSRMELQSTSTGLWKRVSSPYYMMLIQVLPYGEKQQWHSPLSITAPLPLHYPMELHKKPGMVTSHLLLTSGYLVPLRMSMSQKLRDTILNHTQPSVS